MIARTSGRFCLLSRPARVAGFFQQQPFRRFADGKLPRSSRQIPNSKTQPGQRAPSNAAIQNGPLTDRVVRDGKASAGSAESGSAQSLDPPPYSEQQEEFQTGARSESNTAPLSTGGGPGTARSASPSGRVNAEAHVAKPPPGEADSIGASIRSGRLADLTKGIPSTLDQEFQSVQVGLRSDGTSGDSQDGPAGLPSSTGGRGSKELPRTAYISSIERRKGRLVRFALAAFLFLSVTGTLYMGRNWESAEEEKKHANAPSGRGLGPFYHRLRARLFDTRSYYTEPAFEKLLPDPDPTIARPFTLVLSLEDLLVHSEWSREHGWRMAKRPGVDYFLRYLQQYYELVIFTSTPMVMAEPVIRKLDPYRIVMWPLFREATKFVDGTQVKDLSYLNRDLSKVIIVDTDPAHVKLQPGNAIILPKWTGDPADRDLVALIPFLEYVATMGLTDTRTVLKSFEGKHIPTEFAAREAVARRKFEEQMSKERGQRPHRLGKGLLDTVMGGRGGAGADSFEQSAAEAFEQGKMLQDYIRERGQKQYEMLEKEIQENGEKWLKEMATEEEKMMEEHTKGMKTSVAGFLGGWLNGTSKKMDDEVRSTSSPSLTSSSLSSSTVVVSPKASR